MMYEELEKRIPGIEYKDFEAVEPLYNVLNLDKDDFAKIAKAVGVKKLAEKANRWRELQEARTMYRERQEYLKAKEELTALHEQKERLVKVIRSYRENYGD